MPITLLISNSNQGLYFTAEWMRLVHCFTVYLSESQHI